ncbi:LacI family DNA-binding transcriptional regulator [Lysinibacter sp. HNR]|uniref:LacI family DNA-binding transcriptional regulator n=1 Tax=Lysinibacter sp. HNR TaxID=3031408 RepID=UPI002435414F|nr:LacI family DNA-binding transcriptional regulator [Lysinibacter sp. HNR]WGD38181.1 LacI family DNA-binding transcriptional regulator [Lysinibacter sp. HNR]
MLNNKTGSTRPTMADIARISGLSIPTVSRALRNHPDVSPATKRTVQETATKLGYSVSSVARALRTGHNRALSFVVPLGIIGWWEPLLKGASAEAAKLGYTLILNPVEPSSKNNPPSSSPLTHLFERVYDLPVDGFVIVTPENDSWQESTRAAKKPVVVIDDTREHPGFHVWLNDNYAGAKTAVEHLIAQGRTKIIALAPTHGMKGMVIEERLAGYRDTLAAAGLNSMVLYSDETYPPTQETSHAINRAIETGLGFDGVFALADYISFSALRSLRQGGLDVPGDVSVVGFDDDVAATATDPSLTTLAQPLGEIGAASVRTLIDLIQGANSVPRSHRLQPRFVKRKSS